jgi:two-component system CheB/CheR fusion protein
MPTKRKPTPRKRATNTKERTPAAGRRPAKNFPIVGIGASAGGLEAFTELLKRLPANTGMGFVLVQHLDPTHESELAQLLGRVASMPVKEATNGVEVAPDHIYVMPSNAMMTIARGVLTLEPRPDKRGVAHAIDVFFESLAKDRHEGAIGVVLSGTASDGTRGLEAIKAEGGIAFAQDDSARYDSMPRSAVASGHVDFVLPPAGNARELARLASHPYVVDAEKFSVGAMGDAARAAADTPEPPVERERQSVMAHEDDATPLPSGGHGTPRLGTRQARAEADHRRHRPGDDAFKTVLEMLHRHSGVDFSLYRSTTMQRRIARRMVLLRCETLADYAKRLRSDAKERDTLYTDVLIGVTSFFRNPEAFDALKRVVFPAIAPRRDEPVRVWVLGCSTGQEAYSIAMAFVEHCDRAHRAPRLQIFATDLNGTLLDKARAGLYSRRLTEDLSPERVRRFFTEEDGGYRVVKSLREMVVFARQNVARDPPFSRIDLVSCRNLLIYLEPTLQQRAMPMFHYALNPGGFLLLGASESVGRFTDLFEPIDKKHKIFARKTVAAGIRAWAAEIDASGKGRPRSGMVRTTPPLALRPEMSAQREADRLMANAFAPPGVVVNAELQVIQFRGATSPYLAPPSGKASFDVLKMARPGLMLPLRAAIKKAKKDDEPARKDNVRLGHDGEARSVDIEVVPLREQAERCYLILFHPSGGERREIAKGRRASTAASSASPGDDVRAGSASARDLRRRLAQSERELAEMRDYLESTQELSESANEELQASSEELQSSNEELQSMNEELETSKEELESTNEELTTVNEEIAHRNQELDQLSADLKNVFASTRTAILVVGRELVLRRFTLQAEKLFGLSASDVGRPLRGMRHGLFTFGPGMPPDPPASASPVDLEGLLREVIDDAAANEWDVRDERGRWYSLRATPYFTLDNKIDGAVLMLVDIDSLKRSQMEAQEAREFAEAAIRTMRDPLIVLDADLGVMMANEAFYRTFRTGPDETEGRRVYDLGSRQWDIPRLRTLLEDILPRNAFFNDFEVVQDFPSIGRRTMLLNARQLRPGTGKPRAILLAIEDVTERLESQAAVRASEIRYRRLFEALHEGILLVDPVSRRITDANACAQTLLGYEREQLLGKELWQVGLLGGEQRSHAAFRKLQLEDSFQAEEQVLRASDGSSSWVELSGSIYEEHGSKVIQFHLRDVGERKRGEDALHAARERMRFVLDEMPQKVFTAAPDGAFDYVNPQWTEYTGLGLEDIGSLDAKPILCPADFEATRAAWRECIATGAPYRGQHRLKRVDGEYRWHLTRAVPMRGPSGPILMWVGSSTDIHDLKEEGRHKDEFLAMLAHELRNPLAPMRNVVELLQGAAGNEALVRRLRETLDRQLAQLTRLVSDLLDASRISRGVLDLRLEDVELASIVEQAVEASRPAIDRGRHQLEVTAPEQPVVLRADRARLSQVLGNLLDNAAKYTPGGGRISLTVEPRDGEVAISIRDSGVGIAAGKLGEIFGMFTQLDRSPERAQGGMGIGLALAKQLVEMHGGSIVAKSEGAGKGSEFLVRLPVLVQMPA